MTEEEKTELRTRLRECFDLSDKQLDHLMDGLMFKPFPGAREEDEEDSDIPLRQRWVVVVGYIYRAVKRHDLPGQTQEEVLARGLSERVQAVRKDPLELLLEIGENLATNGPPAPDLLPEESED